MKTVNMYDLNNNLIIVNESDVDKYKVLGFSRKKRAEKKADDVISMTDISAEISEKSEKGGHTRKG
jgi:hypothetical protein